MYVLIFVCLTFDSRNMTLENARSSQNLPPAAVMPRKSASPVPTASYKRQWPPPFTSHSRQHYSSRLQMPDSSAAHSVQRWWGNWGSVVWHRPPECRDVRCLPTTLSATQTAAYIHFSCAMYAISCITPDNSFNRFHVWSFVMRDSWPLLSLTGTEVHEWTVRRLGVEIRETDCRRG